MRPDALNLMSQEDAIRWMHGKTIATPQGSFTDMIAQATFEQLHVKPAAYLNQALDVVTSGFSNHKIDGVIVWEPTASKLVNAGLAKRVASGSYADMLDAGFMLMDKELIDERSDVAKGWLNAELEAQKYLADPANSDEIVKLVQTQTEGFSDQDLRDALYKSWPASKGGSTEDVRLWLPFAPDRRSRASVDYASGFLYDIKAIPAPKLPAGSVHAEIAEKVLTESGSAEDEGVVKGEVTTQQGGGG